MTHRIRSTQTLLLLLLSLGIAWPGATLAAGGGSRSAVANQVKEDRAAIRSFFTQEELTLTVFPRDYVEELDEVIVPVKLSNGSSLRIEIPWDDPATLEAFPQITLYPNELAEFAGRLSPYDDVRVIEGSVAAHMTTSSRATICGNRSVSVAAVIGTPSGSRETELGFIYQPSSSDFVARSVAASAGCPLLASSKDCRTHKYCEVRVGIPPFTITVSGRCYPGPWPLGDLCRCWLLAPDPKEPAAAILN